jgi:hypothetical protein
VRAFVRQLLHRPFAFVRRSAVGFERHFKRVGSRDIVQIEILSSASEQIERRRALQ